MYEFMSIRKKYYWVINMFVSGRVYVLSNGIAIVLSQVNNVHHSGQQVTVDRPFDKFSVTTAYMM